METRKLFVVAERYADAQAWAREQRLWPGWTYLTPWSDGLRGQRAPAVVLLPGWERRADAPRLGTDLRSVSATYPTDFGPWRLS